MSEDWIRRVHQEGDAFLEEAFAAYAASEAGWWRKAERDVRGAPDHWFAESVEHVAQEVSPAAPEGSGGIRPVVVEYDDPEELAYRRPPKGWVPSRKPQTGTGYPPLTAAASVAAVEVTFGPADQDNDALIRRIAVRLMAWGPSIECGFAPLPDGSANGFLIVDIARYWTAVEMDALRVRIESCLERVKKPVSIRPICVTSNSTALWDTSEWPEAEEQRARDHIIRIHTQDEREYWATCVSIAERLRLFRYWRADAAFYIVTSPERAHKLGFNNENSGKGDIPDFVYDSVAQKSMLKRISEAGLSLQLSPYNKLGQWGTPSVVWQCSISDSRGDSGKTVRQSRAEGGDMRAATCGALADYLTRFDLDTDRRSGNGVQEP